jgi:phenylalanine ammonia-lyase
MILVRCNSIIRGHSGVRTEIAEFLIAMLAKDILPLIPESGSISASGDLAPLSYLGGLLEGNPDTFVRTKDKRGKQIVSAAEALKNANMEPLRLQPKEGLGVMNGTAPSTSAAALAVHDSHVLAVLAQVLTAMSTEALQGTVDNYHDFISTCRPHPGQREVASNIRRFLRCSRLCRGHNEEIEGLAQDRYDLRTAPQWIGPQLEDLLAADRQVSIELNATTDNPLINVEENTYHHGGNFQATVVTSAMEKTRTSLLMLGKLLLAQCQQMVDPLVSNGLPPNLCVQDPHLSFAAKGVEINMAAYCSELGFLANSVVSSMQSAEMRNQSVNSLALLSARYTAKCVEILSMMCAAHLYTVCQALDLRVLQLEFFNTAKSACEVSFHRIFNDLEGYEKPSCDSWFGQIWSTIKASWLERSRLGLQERCAQVSRDCLGYIVNTAESNQTLNACQGWYLIQSWNDSLPTILENSYRNVHKRSSEARTTPQYLGTGTKPIYQFVREQLQVPFHEGIKDHPVYRGKNDREPERKTIGSYISRIYIAIRGDELARQILSISDELSL